MANELDRIVEETNKLQKSIAVAQALKGSFLRYPLITALVTSILTIAIAWGLAVVLGSQQAEEHTERNTQALVCILNIPPDLRTLQDTKYCLRATDIDPKDIPRPPLGGRYPGAGEGESPGDASQ